MPTFVALVVATLLAQLAEAVVPETLGGRMSAIVALVTWLGAFSVIRRWPITLRPDTQR